MTQTGRPNRLAQETSPYLLQHAYNPVDWYPWGPEALEAARAQDKPIFLSIGYSACHWCHVMEHESFEDPATAAVMNELFINVKVDREERPDLDQIYMTATQLMTRHGGWPMSVWLASDLKPFYAGTYFPPEPRHGMPAFRTLCQYLGEVWKNRRQDVSAAADDVTRQIEELNQLPGQAGAVDVGMIATSAQTLAGFFDRRLGGIGSAPKFPHTTELRMMLRAWRRTGIDDYRQLVELTLDQMIRGGIYDQLGGGFHRYSTDERWLVPHFEKMLYDNALIPLACFEAAQATTDPELRRTFQRATCETLDYVLREMTSPAGPFFSTQDADSEGVEGKFFVWSQREVLDILGEELGAIACAAYDVTEHGNWEEANILHLAKPLSDTARALGLSVEALEEKLGVIRCKLFGMRSQRVAPGRDEKILVAWNGMMIDTLAVVDGGQGGKYVEAASRAADFILKEMRTGQGLLLRTYKDGRARLNAYLEDYSYLANGLVSLYEATGETRWIDQALALVETMINEFWDEEGGGFFFTGKGHESLITRGKDPRDGATPSGNAMAVMALARLAKLTGRREWAAYVDRTLSSFKGVLEQSAMASAQMLIALDLHAGPTLEIALVGEADHPEVQAGLRLLREQFLPNRVLARKSRESEEVGEVALLADRPMRSPGLTAYICREFTCSAPAVGPEEFAAALSAATTNG